MHAFFSILFCFCTIPFVILSIALKKGPSVVYKKQTENVAIKFTKTAAKLEPFAGRAAIVIGTGN